MSKLAKRHFKFDSLHNIYILTTRQNKKTQHYL